MSIASAPPMTLGEAIASFDRKERRAVLRLCGGEQAAKVDEHFATILARKPGLENSKLAGLPWYIDYHWNWLGAALTLFARRGVPPPTLEPANIYENNQEDVDALIVTGNTLILIEAKWDGALNWHQYESKLERLKKVDALIASSAQLRGIVDWHFVVAGRGIRQEDREKACLLMDEKGLLKKSRPFFLDLEAILLPPPRLPLYAVMGLGKNNPRRIATAPGWGTGDWPEAGASAQREN